MTEQAELTRPKAGGTIQTVNPANGQAGKRYDEISLDDALRAATAAHEAFLKWRRTASPNVPPSSTRPPQSFAPAG